MRNSLLVALSIGCLASVVHAQDKTGTLAGTFLSKIKIKTRGKTSQKDLILYLEPKGATKKLVQLQPPKKPVKVLQKRLNFSPHVLPVIKGTKVQFKNSDKVKHNLFTKGKCCPVDKDMAGSTSVTLTYATPGQATIICRLHPEMSMHVLVLETPLFTTTKFKRVKVKGKSTYQGDYSLAGIPPGEYTLKSWNKKLPGLAQTVKIAAGKTAKLDLVFEKSGASAAPPK